MMPKLSWSSCSLLNRAFCSRDPQTVTGPSTRPCSCRHVCNNMCDLERCFQCESLRPSAMYMSDSQTCVEQSDLPNYIHAV